MVRDIPADLNSMLQSSALTVSLCVKVSRTDGVQLGFTTFTEDMIIDGITYETIGSVNSEELKQSATSGVDNLNIIGLLTSDLITEIDIIAGRYNRCEITLFVINFRDLTNGAMILQRGRWGEVTLRDGQYTAELRGLTNNFKQYISCITQPTCRVRRFCDNQCKLNRTDYQSTLALSALATDQKTLRFNGFSSAAGDYNYGMVYSLSGENNGLIRQAKFSLSSGIDTIIRLRENFPFNITVGDMFMLEQGCNRTFPRCDQFSNTINFRGEPFLPGNDAVMTVGRPPNA